MIGGLTVTWYKSHRRDLAVVVRQNRRNGKIVPEKKLCIAWITKKKETQVITWHRHGNNFEGEKLNISLKRHRNLQTKCQVTQEFEGSSVFQNIGCDQRPGNKFFWNINGAEVRQGPSAARLFRRRWRPVAALRALIYSVLPLFSWFAGRWNDVSGSTCKCSGGRKENWKSNSHPDAHEYHYVQLFHFKFSIVHKDDLLTAILGGKQIFWICLPNISGKFA